MMFHWLPERPASKLFPNAPAPWERNAARQHAATRHHHRRRRRRSDIGLVAGEAGYKVTLLERNEQVAIAASYRNGGQLSYRYVAPLADAGVPFKALQWLLQKDGPLRFRPEADWRQWRWMASFLRNCNATSNARTTAKLLELGELSRAGMAQLELTVPPEAYAWRDAGKLIVYRSPAIFQRAVARPESEEARLVLSPLEAVQREPALAALQNAWRAAFLPRARRWPIATPFALRWKRACCSTRIVRSY